MPQYYVGHPHFVTLLYVCGISSHTADFLVKERKLEQFAGMKMFGSTLSGSQEDNQAIIFGCPHLSIGCPECKDT